MSGRKEMRAIRVAQYGGPEVLKVDSKFQVPLPTDTQVLVEVKAAGVNPVDTYIRSGARGTTGPLPYIPGSDVAEIVSKVGAKVKKFKANGLTMIGTAGTREGLDFVLQHGAAKAFNHKEPGYIDKVLEATNGSGPDIIIEMLTNVNLDSDLKIINKGGIIVFVGSRGNAEIAPRLLMFKESIVTGFLLWSAPTEEWTAMHQEISDGLTAGWLIPNAQKEYKLEEAGLAHEEIINNSGTTGNMIRMM